MSCLYLKMRYLPWCVDGKSETYISTLFCQPAVCFSPCVMAEGSCFDLKLVHLNHCAQRLQGCHLPFYAGL